MRALLTLSALSLVACGVNTEPILADGDAGIGQHNGPAPDATRSPPPNSDGDGGNEINEADVALFDARRAEDPCSDGLERTCPDAAPDCPAEGHTATLRGGCWVCVDPATCPPAPDSACEAGAAWSYACPVAGYSVPWCTCGEDGVVACVADPRAEACCGDDEQVVCESEPEPCAEGTIGSQFAGCWACVDAELRAPAED